MKKYYEVSEMRTGDDGNIVSRKFIWFNGINFAKAYAQNIYNTSYGIERHRLYLFVYDWEFDHKVKANEINDITNLCEIATRCGIVYTPSEEG